MYYQGVKTLAPVDEKNVPLVDPNELFGNLAEVIAVNDELACQFQNIRDHRGLVQSIGPSLLDWIPKVFFKTGVNFIRKKDNNRRKSVKSFRKYQNSKICGN